MSSRTKYFVVSTSTCLTVLLLIGSVIGRSASPDDTYKHMGVFADVVSRIKSEYVEEPDMKSVTLGALNGMLEAIDPFASYLNADQYRDYLKNKDVKRADVGLILSKKFGYVGVVGTITGSPAAKANFTTGDMIESIGGVATRDMPLAYASMLLQGESGTTVDLSVVRVRHPEPTAVKLTRATFALPAVESRTIGDKVGYINVDALSPALVKEVAANVQKLQKDGATKLVLDLRNCATGSPEDGIALANLFMKSGRITYLVGQKMPRQNFDADPAKAITALPLAVLTNRGTADAAEVAAAALMDNKRAQVVGERTYGDAAVRRAITMEDGGAIILSVAKYYSPDGGKAIQDAGVTPNNTVSDTDAQVEVDDNGEPAPEAAGTEKQKKVEDDAVVKKALELLAKG
ncbi:MAG: carboxyl-terminal protease [Candidatus Solibacter sp.]|jgi:carboxyl-terminal processing protease|nr:carboxyl-terminal protease [Candidatus Solibacter sp.]